MMHRWRSQLVIFALIGAASNTFTAFVAGVMADQLADLELIETDPIPWINANANGSWTNWLVLEHRYFGVSHFVGHSGTWCWGPPVREGFVPPTYLRVDVEFHSCTATGFPMRSFVGEYKFRGLPDISPWDESQFEPKNMLEFEFPTPTSSITSSRDVALPTRPLWAGFVVNSVVHGSLLFGLVRGPSLIRRGLRSRRGRCPACAYDLNHNLAPGCPECGWGKPGNGDAGGEGAGSEEVA